MKRGGQNVERGYPATEEETLSRYDSLIRYLAGRYAWSYHRDFEDTYVVAKVAAVEAHRSYDSSRGAQFRTHLTNCVRWAMSRWFRYEDGEGRGDEGYRKALVPYVGSYWSGEMTIEEIAKETGYTVRRVANVLPGLCPKFIAIHTACNYDESEETRALTWEDILPDRDAVDPEEAVTGTFGTLEAEVFWEDVDAILASLDKPTREAFDLMGRQGLSSRAAARTLKSHPETVRLRYRTALALLKERLPRKWEAIL